VKRIGHLMDRVTDFGNLVLAFRKASRGKRRRPAVVRFFRDLETELLRLATELAEGSYRPGPFQTFTIRDPKERLISCPPFRDRVVHHAVVNLLEPILEARFDPDSYGCRKGRGMDAALGRALAHTRRHPFFLRTDVRRFYDSIDRRVLHGQLGRILKDRRLLGLLVRIVGEEGTGLPIGSLTSQWLANLYLTPLDRWLRIHRDAKGQTRYMDDVLVFGDDRAGLRRVRTDLRAYLRSELRLELKENVTRTGRTRDGVPFLGFRMHPSGVHVRRTTLRRFFAGVRDVEWRCRTGEIDAQALAASVTSRIAHLDRGRSLPLRRRFFERRRAMEW